jgi:hypothetical protein
MQLCGLVSLIDEGSRFGCNRILSSPFYYSHRYPHRYPHHLSLALSIHHLLYHQSNVHLCNMSDPTPPRSIEQLQLELEAEKARTAELTLTVQQLQHELEHERELAIQQADLAKKTREELMVQIEQEEEYLTNSLQAKLQLVCRSNNNNNKNCFVQCL